MDIQKPPCTPCEQDFLSWMDEAQIWAREVGYREEDLESIIKDVRGQS